MNQKKNKIIVFLQDEENPSAFSIIHHLIEEQPELLKEYVNEIHVHRKGTSWKSQYSKLRKELINLGISLKMEDLNSYAINPVNPTLLIPLSNHLANSTASRWYVEYRLGIHRFDEYWRPNNSIIRLLSAYLPEMNNFSLQELFVNGSELFEKVNSIENLNVISRSIDCSKIMKLNHSGFLQDKAKSYLNNLKESLGESQIVLRSNTNDFHARFYVDEEQYFEKSSESNYHLVNNLISDIKNYSDFHPDHHLFIQPYFTGIEYVTNTYTDDFGITHSSIFRVQSDEEGFESLTPRLKIDEPKLTNILKKLSEMFKFKFFSARFIKNEVDGSFALLNFDCHYSHHLPAVLKYQLDIISYELTRGLMSEEERKKLLFRKYYTEYTDEVFKANLIY